MLVAQTLRDRGHRHLGIQPVLDAVIVRRDQRPRRRPYRRITQLREPPGDQLRPLLGAQWFPAGLDAISDCRGHIFADGLTIDPQRLR